MKRNFRLFKSSSDSAAESSEGTVNQNNEQTAPPLSNDNDHKHQKLALIATFSALLAAVLIVFVWQFLPSLTPSNEGERYALRAGETVVNESEYNKLREDAAVMNQRYDSFLSTLEQGLQYKEYMRQRNITLTEDEISQADEFNFASVEGASEDQTLETNSWRRFLAEYQASVARLEDAPNGSYEGYYIVATFDRYIIPSIEGELPGHGDEELIEEDRVRARQEIERVHSVVEEDPSQLEAIAEEFRNDDQFWTRRSKQFGHNPDEPWEIAIGSASVRSFIQQQSDTGLSEIQTLFVAAEGENDDSAAREGAYYFVYLTEAEQALAVDMEELNSIEVEVNGDVVVNPLESSAGSEEEGDE